MDTTKTTDEENALLECIRQYHHTNGTRPRLVDLIQQSPFGSTRSQQILEDLIETERVVRETQPRHGNPVTVYACAPPPTLEQLQETGLSETELIAVAEDYGYLRTEGSTTHQSPGSLRAALLSGRRRDTESGSCLDSLSDDG